MKNSSSGWAEDGRDCPGSGTPCVPSPGPAGQRDRAELGSLGTILLAPSCRARITTSPALGALRGTSPPEHRDVLRDVPALFALGQQGSLIDA